MPGLERERGQEHLLSQLLHRQDMLEHEHASFDEREQNRRAVRSAAHALAEMYRPTTQEKETEMDQLEQDLDEHAANRKLREVYHTAYHQHWDESPIARWKLWVPLSFALAGVLPWGLGLPWLLMDFSHTIVDVLSWFTGLQALVFVVDVAALLIQHFMAWDHATDTAKDWWRFKRERYLRDLRETHQQALAELREQQVKRALYAPYGWPKELEQE